MTTDKLRNRKRLLDMEEHARRERTIWLARLEALPTSDYIQTMPEAVQHLSVLHGISEACRILARQILALADVDAVAIAYLAASKNNLKRIQMRREDILPKRVTA